MRTCANSRAILHDLDSVRYGSPAIEGRIIQVLRMVMMKRVVAVIACGLSLSACGSMGMSDMFKTEPPTVNVRMESEPAGAEARVTSGGNCRTPCSLTLPATGPTTISFSLPGYQPQTVPVTVSPPEGGFAGLGASEPRAEPNPAFATLELIPPPPRKKAPPKKRRVAKPRPPAAAPAAEAPAEQQPAAQAPPQQQPGFGPPNGAPPQSVFR